MPMLTNYKPTTDFDLDIVKPDDGEVAALAYQLWEDRGRPIGSPEDDWFIAERELTNHPRLHHYEKLTRLD